MHPRTAVEQPHCKVLLVNRWMKGRHFSWDKASGAQAFSVGQLHFGGANGTWGRKRTLADSLSL